MRERGRELKPVSNKSLLSSVPREGCMQATKYLIMIFVHNFKHGMLQKSEDVNASVQTFYGICMARNDKIWLWLWIP